MLLGGGMESLAKNILNRDIEIKKRLVKELHRYLSIAFHEEANRGNEYAPSKVHTKRILSFVQQASIIGCTGNGTSAITSNFESSDSSLVEFSLSLYRHLLAGVLSLPVQNKLRTTFVDAQSTASANASGTSSEPSHSSAVLAIVKYIEQGNHLLTHVPTVDTVVLTNPTPLTTESNNDNNTSTPSNVPKRKVGGVNGAVLPDPATLSLLCTPTIIGVIEALRCLHLLMNECYNPSHSANSRPTYEEVIQNGFVNVTNNNTTTSKSSSTSSSSSSTSTGTTSNLSRSLSPRRGSNSITSNAGGTVLRSSITNLIPRLLTSLLSLAQVRSVELDDEPNAKTGTQTIRSLATLCIADCTWLLVNTVPSMASPSSTTMPRSGSTSIGSSTNNSSTNPTPTGEMNARLSLIQNMSTIITILSRSLHDQTTHVQSAIIRLSLEKTGMVTPNGEVPPPAPANLAPSVVVAEPVPVTKVPEKGTGKAPAPTDNKKGKDAKPEPTPAPAPAPVPVSALAPAPPPPIGAEYGLEAGQYESTCKYLVDTSPAGDENSCWSYLNPIDVGATNKEVIPKVRILDNPDNHVSTEHHDTENEKKYDTFSFAIASIEHGYTVISHILCAFLRCSVAVPYVTGTFASIVDNEHDDEHEADTANTDIKRIPTWKLVSTCVASLLAIPETSHKREITKLLSLVLARMVACSDSLRTTACAAGVLPVLASRLRDTDTDARTRDVVEGVIHVLLSSVSTVLSSSNGTVVPATVGPTGTGMNRSVSSIHSSMISVPNHNGTAENKHDDESKHETNDDDGIAVLQGNPHHPGCVPISQTAPHMVSTEYLTEITGPEVPSTFVRRLVDPRVLIFDSAGANAAGITLENTTSSNAVANPIDPKANAKNAKSAPNSKPAPSATSNDTSDKSVLVPEPALPAGFTRSTLPNIPSATFGPWLGTIDIAFLLCAGYTNNLGNSNNNSNGSATTANNSASSGTVPTPTSSRPPSRSAVDSSSVVSGTVPSSSSSAMVELPPVTPPSTVFDHTCPDLPSTWPIWNLPLDDLLPIIAWVPVTVGSGSLHTELEEDMHQSHTGNTDLHQPNGSVAQGTKPGTVVAKPDGGKGTIPSHSSTPTGTKKGSSAASSVGHSESGTRTHGGIHDLPKPSMVSVAKSFALLIPSQISDNSNAYGSLVWDSRLRGLRLAASFIRLAEENQAVRDILLASKLPAMVARIMVDAVTCAYRIPFMVGAVAGTLYSPPVASSSGTNTLDTSMVLNTSTDNISSSVTVNNNQTTINHYQSITVDNDVLLQSLLLTFHMLFTMLRLPGNASADIFITLSELGPIVPDSILAAALHTDVLKILPSLNDVFTSCTTKLNMNHFNRTESFLIPVCLTDPRSILQAFDKLPGTTSTYSLTTEVGEIRSWALYTLRAFAAADREHRTYDWSSPIVPIPGRSVVNKEEESTNDASKKGGAASKTAPPKDTGKKLADKGKVAPAPTDAAPVAVNTVFKAPQHPPAGSPVVGVDWNCKTESIGERLALSVVRYVPLLMASLSHNATAGGLLYPILSGPLMTNNLAVQPLTGSAVRIGILHLIDEAFTVYRARDRLTVEVMSILREYSVVIATLRKQKREPLATDTNSLSAYTTAALAAAQRLFTTPRHDNGLPLLYGRLGTLVLGYSMGFNGQLHSLSSAGYGPSSSVSTTTTATAPPPTVTNEKKAPAKPAVADKKGAKPVATPEPTVVSTESFTAILAARRNWKHPIENWGNLPSPVSSQIEDVIHSLHNPSSTDSSTDGHPSQQKVPLYHDFDRFCTYGKPYYIGIELPTITETEAPPVAVESRPPTSTSTAKPDPKKPAPVTTKGAEPHAAVDTVVTEPKHPAPASVLVSLPNIFTLPQYVWPVTTTMQETVQNIYSDQPQMDTVFNGSYLNVPSTAIEVLYLYQSSTDILKTILGHVNPVELDAICAHGTLALQDSARAILTSTILAGFLKPIAKFTAYREPLPSEPEILLGFRILSRIIIDSYRGSATQTATAELAVAEAIRAGIILHTLAMTDMPPVPVEAHQFSHTVINDFIHGVRPLRSLPNEKLWLWKNSIVFSPTGRNVLTMEARTLLMYLRNRPDTRLQHWGRVSNVHTRSLSTEESTVLPSLGEHPDWSLLPEGITQVDIANHTVTEEIYLGRDDPLYPTILDSYLTTLTVPSSTEAHGEALSPSTEAHPPSTDVHHAHSTDTELMLSVPVLNRNVIANRKTYFSTFIFGPVLDIATPVGRLGNQVLSPLFAAIVLDADEAFISSLVNNGASVDVRRSGDNVTPLMSALAGGKLSIAAALLGHGADPNAKDGSGNPVIKYAFVTTNQNDKKDVQALEADRTAAAVELPMDTVYSRLQTTLEHTYLHPSGSGHRKASTSSSTPSLGSIKQMFGASAAILQRMARRMILRRRLDAARRSLRDSHSLKNHVPVVFADRQMVIDAMRLLIDSGADVMTAKDAGGNTVLHWLVAGAFLMYPALHTKSCRYVPVYHAPPSLGEDTRQLMDLFLAFGARINAQNNRGATPLHCALECGKMAVSVHLVKLGADTALADKIGCLPMHYAALGRGFHDMHPGLTNVYESTLTDLSGELNAAEAALFDKQEINEHLPQARIVSPRAEFFLDMVLRALQHGREVDGKQVVHQQNSSSVSSLESKNGPVRPKVRSRRSNPSSRSTHENPSTYSSKEMDGDDYEFSESKDNPEEIEPNDDHILRPLTPSDILLHTNRYGITPLHVAAGANIDGTLSLTLRQGSTAYSMPTTFTGVHPMLLTLARHGSSVRAAAITVNGVNFNGNVDTPTTETDEIPNSETFIMVAINREYTAEFLFGCADETAARADIMYTALGLPDVLSGARAILAEVRAMQADHHLQALLTECMNLFENRQGHVAATKVISREDVIDATKLTLDLSHSHAEALVTARCKSGRNALHYAMLSWHSPLQELIGAGGKYLLGKEGTVLSSNVTKTRNGIVAGLRAHYAACWRIARYLVAASRGTLATPVMREPLTIEAWRRSRPRHVNTLAYIPSREEDKGGHTDADTVPYPGVALIQRREIIADASTALLVEDRPPIGRVRTDQQTSNNKKHAVANAVVSSASSSIKDKNETLSINGITPQGSQISENSITTAGTDGRKDTRPSSLILRGFTPVGYSLIHLRMLPLYSTALVGIDSNDLGIALTKDLSPITASNSGSSTDSFVNFTTSAFVPAHLGIRGIIESPTWAIIALGLFSANDPTSMDNNSIDYYYNNSGSSSNDDNNMESKEKELADAAEQINIYSTTNNNPVSTGHTSSIILNRERAKRGNPTGAIAASGALELLKGTIDPSPSLMKVLTTTAGRK